MKMEQYFVFLMEMNSEFQQTLKSNAFGQLWDLPAAWLNICQV